MYLFLEDQLYKDFIPILLGWYEPHPTWTDTLNKKEEALRNCHMKTVERCGDCCQSLLGDHVHIQSQTGTHPLKWDKTGHIVEIKQYDQYAVCLNRSGCGSLWNRKFLCEFLRAQKWCREIHSIIQDLKFFPISSGRCYYNICESTLQLSRFLISNCFDNIISEQRICLRYINTISQLVCRKMNSLIPETTWVIPLI